MNKIIFLFLMIPRFSFAITEEQLKNFRDISVRVTSNIEGSSGGTGSIISSSETETIILTNQHVCEVVEKGGFVLTTNKAYKVNQYKIYPYHDLCLVKIKANLEKSLIVSRKTPKPAEKSYVTGHPHLLPNIVTEGHFTDVMSINIVVDVRDCTAKEHEQDPFTCMFLGFPIVKTFESQLTSNQIQSGNSGSAVLNSNGELSGVVFAGSGEISWAFIVPHSAVVHFLATQNFYSWKNPMLNKQKVNKNTSKKQEAKKACAQTLVYPNDRVETVCKLLKRNTLE